MDPRQEKKNYYTFNVWKLFKMMTFFFEKWTNH